MRLHCLGQGRALGVLPVHFACAGSAGLARLRPHALNPAAWLRNPCATVILVFPPGAGAAPEEGAFFRDRLRPGLRGALTRARERERAAAQAGRSPYLAAGDRVVVVIESPGAAGAAGGGAPQKPAPAASSFGAKFRKSAPASLFERVRDECGSGWRVSSRDAGGALGEHVVRWDPDDPDSWRQGPERVLAQAAQRALDARLTSYQEETQALSAARLAPGWSFPRFFVVKEARALLFEMAGLCDDALREYTELEYTYLDSLRARRRGSSGGSSPKKVSGDSDSELDASGSSDGAALLDTRRRPVREWFKSGGPKEFSVRQYLFARQSALLLRMGQPEAVAKRGVALVDALGRRLAPGTADLWVFSACVSLAEATRGGLDFPVRRGDGGGDGTSGDKGEDGALQRQTYAGTLAELYAKARARLVALGGKEGFDAIRLSPSPCFSRPQGGSQGPSRAGSIENASAEHLQSLSRGQSDSFESALVQLERESYGASGTDEEDAFFLTEEAVFLAVAEDTLGSHPAGADVADDGEVDSIGSPQHCESLSTSPKDPDAEPGGGLALAGAEPETPAAAAVATAGSSADAPVSVETLGNGTEAFSSATPGTARSDTLQAAVLRSRGAYEELLIELSRKAAEFYRRAGRPRHAAEVEGDIAGLLLESGNLGQAELLLKEQSERYQAEGWGALQSRSLPMLLRAQLGLWETGSRRGGDLAVSLVDTIVQLLSVRESETGTFSRRVLMDHLLSISEARAEGIEEGSEVAPRGTVREQLRKEVDATAVVRIDGRTLWEGGGEGLTTSRSLHIADVGKFSLRVVSCFPAVVTLQGVSLTLARRDGEAKGFGRRRRSIIASQSSESLGPDARLLRCFPVVGKQTPLPGGEEHAQAPGSVVVEPGANILQFCVQPTSSGEYTTHALHFSIESVQFLSYVPPGQWDQVPFSMLPFHRTTCLKVLPEAERVRITAAAEVPSGLVEGAEQWLGLLVEPLHDHLKDSRLSVVLADEDASVSFVPNQDAYGVADGAGQADGGGFGSPFDLGCERGAQRLEGVVRRSEAYLELLPVHAEGPSAVWLRVQAPRLGPLRVALLPGSLEKSHSQGTSCPDFQLAAGLEYTDGTRRSHEATFSIPVLRPFAVQTEFAVLGPETLLVQLSLRNSTMWEIELRNAALELDPGLEVLQDTVSEGGLLPAKVQSGGLFSFLFYLNVASSGSSAPGAALNRFSVEYAWPGAVRKAFPLKETSGFGIFDGTAGPRATFPALSVPAAARTVEDTLSLEFELCLPAFRYALGLRELPASTRGSPTEIVWTVEHIGEATSDTVEYEVVYDANSWLLSGRRIGIVQLSADAAPAEIKLTFIPTSAGALPAPQLLLSCSGEGGVFTSPLASSPIPVRPPPFQEAWMVPAPLGGALLESP